MCLFFQSVYCLSIRLFIPFAIKFLKEFRFLKSYKNICYRRLITKKYYLKRICDDKRYQDNFL
jgi:hypothetical protein